MEFILVFAVSLVAMLLLTCALMFGRAPVYRPQRCDIYHMIQALQQGAIEQERWALFVGLPVVHDPELEVIRQRCYALECAAEEGQEGICFGLGNYRYNMAGMTRLHQISQSLKLLIEQAPIVKVF